MGAPLSESRALVACFAAFVVTTAAAPPLDLVECEQTPTCALEENCECQVSGITARWRAAYCMALEQTDDLEQAGVQRCLSRPEPSAIRHATACGKNEYWKRMICRATPSRTDVEACVRDRTFIPGIVARGPGAPEP